MEEHKHQWPRPRVHQIINKIPYDLSWSYFLVMTVATALPNGSPFPSCWWTCHQYAEDILLHGTLQIFEPYILINYRWKSSILDSCAYRRAETDSLHRIMFRTKDENDTTSPKIFWLYQVKIKGNKNKRKVQLALLILKQP